MDLEFLKNYQAIIGIDEVGRGPIAGPVCACAVKISDPDIVLKLSELDITDSKKLSAKKRSQILNLLGVEVQNLSLDKIYEITLFNSKIKFVLSELDHIEIDKINILQASLKAMKNCSDKLFQVGDLNLIDGNKTFDNGKNSMAIVKGDSKCISIALASIIAKNFRDEKMSSYAKEFPGYQFEKHAGYPTQQHKDAVKKLGPSPIHRKTFKGVKEFL